MDLISLIFSQIIFWIGLPLILICGFCQMAGIKSSSFLSGLIGAFFSVVTTTITATIFFLSIAAVPTIKLLGKVGKDIADKAREAAEKNNNHHYQEVDVEVVEKNWHD